MGKRRNGCTKCGASVNWKKVGQRWQCFDPDGAVHWDNCSKRRWAQVKATGKRFETTHESGYENSIHGTRFDHILARYVTKPDVPIVDCPNCVPPWEVCPNKCPNALPRRAHG